MLHTWTRALDYHPHVHLLVSAGGLSADGQHWIGAKHPAYLVPVRALSVIFRAKLCATLEQAGLLARTPRARWNTHWVVHCQSAGTGDAVLQYLARYVFRIAISNSRLERFEHGQVQFRYRDNRTQRLHHLRLPALAFLARFLQHVLPRGLAKVRYYGLSSPSAGAHRHQARALLDNAAAPSASAMLDTPIASPLQPSASPAQCCAHCHSGRLLIIEVLRPPPRAPP